MTNSRPSELRRGSREWQLAVRTAGYLIARGGRVPAVKLRGIAANTFGFEGSLPKKPNGTSRGSVAGLAVSRVARAFVELDLVRRDGDDLVADDLADVAAWLADELEAEQEFQERRAG